MLYGATGSLDIGEVFKAINEGQIRHQVLVFGLVLWWQVWLSNGSCSFHT